MRLQPVAVKILSHVAQLEVLGLGENTVEVRAYFLRCRALAEHNTVTQIADDGLGTEERSCSRHWWVETFFFTVVAFAKSAKVPVGE